VATNFDDLSKALASGVSRRHALKLMGGAMGGGIAAVMQLGRASAAPDQCQVFCGKTSFTSGPAHAACVQACHKCNADLNRLCFSPTGTTCCASGQLCLNGTCTSATPCVSGGTGCATFCGTGASGQICGCVTTAEGSAACVQEICTFVSCTASSDCPSGQVCFTEGCCGPGGYCIPTCA
jgi:Cys-rich repeat protein